METNEAGQRVFRYLEPLYVTETCLECHGDPKGELDQYGYEKEGMRVGEIAARVHSSPWTLKESGRSGPRRP